MDKNKTISMFFMLVMFRNSLPHGSANLRFSADWHILRLTLVYNVIAIQMYVYFKCTASHRAWLVNLSFYS